MLETKDLVKIYKPKKGVPVTALNKVNIKFSDRGMVFLLGKSGSGKSTLLNVLGGLDNYNDGEIIIKGVSSKDFRQKHFDSYRNTYVGFIFQEYNVIDEFTVGANIALALELQGKKATDDEINRILKEVDLEGFGARKPNELSGGQKQRVAIARALVKNPHIIMADEPTGALDSATGKQVLDTLKKLSKEKLVIVVSHDREFAENYADRIIELSDGVIINDVERTENTATETNEQPLKFQGNTVEIKAEYHLTEPDREAINSYIDSLKGSKLVLNFKGVDALKNLFAKTDESKILIADKTPFKLIKSKLPLKSAFKIGASGLKHKKIRLVITILLSCIAFGLFGLADTFGAYNHVETCTNSLIDSDIDYIATAKARLITTYNQHYWADYGYSLSDKDLAEIEKNTGVKMHGVYLPINSNLGFDSNINPEKVDEDIQFNIYNTYFQGFAEITEKTVSDMGFKLLAGAMPDGTKNEIAVSEYIFEVFKKLQYTDGSTVKDAKGNTVTKYEDIKNYSDLLGKLITLNGEKYKITAVIDTNFDLERYLPLTEQKEFVGNAERLLNYALFSEFTTSADYSYTGIVMTGDGFVKRLIENRPPVAEITKGYLWAYYDNGNIDPSYLAKLEDIRNEKIIWIDGEKKTLGEKELIITADSIESYYDIIVDGNDVSPENEQKTDYAKMFKGKTFNLSKEIFNEKEGTTEEGYTVVGVIETDEKSQLSRTMVCSEKLYNEFTEGKENYYVFCVGTAPKERSSLKNMVKYCYREDTDVRYQIQNSVTFELDSINEALQEFSKIFLYIGLGFALFAALMLANFIGTSISYKKQEIGILRAIGSRGNDVFRIFFSESFIIAMINFVLSALGVLAATLIINYVLRYEIGILVTVLSFSIRQVLLLFAVSVLVAFLASYIPVKKIASKRPIDAIRDR